MGSELSLKDFLGHSGQAPRSPFLKGWKDRPDKSVNTWLSRRAPIRSLWRHQWPKLVEVEDKTTHQKVNVVYGGNLNCYEHESILKLQYRTDRGSGERLAPPEVCPHCRMTDFVRMAVINGQMKWTDPLFRFQASDPSKSVVLHAGGIYNAFGDPKMDDADRADMAAHGIYQKTAWKENTMAKMSYMMMVADDGALNAGLQVSIEPGLLGDKVKAVMRDRRLGKGDEAGDYMRHPFCIRWVHQPSESDFKNKYRALAMDVIPFREEVRAVIDAEPADTSNYTNPFNVEAFRVSLERHALVKLPWDQFFDKVPAHSTSAHQAPAPQVHAHQAPPPARAYEVQTPPAAPVADDACACEVCKGAMRMSDPKCPHCGEVYEVVEAANAPPPPPVLPTRARPSAAAAPLTAPPAPTPAPARVAQPAPPVPTRPATDPGYGALEDDDVPF
jgi:hypothetical protein